MNLESIRCDPADLSADDGEILTKAIEWMRAGKAVALAVVISTWGSAPRAAGSYMAVADDGGFAGSVSGGCVESAVIAEAVDLADDAPPALLSFGVEDETAWNVGLPCGGTIKVAVFRLRQALLDEIVSCLGRRVPSALVLDLASGDQFVAVGDDAIDGILPHDGVLVRVHEPAWTMIIGGAVHISQVLAGIAGAAGFSVTVIDPRRAFAMPERFPGVSLICGEPDEVMADISLDRRTAVVSLTHVPRLDDAVLKAAVASPAFYIGALGSTRTHTKRCERLAELGVGEDRLGRISAPVGIDIGAKTPAEIAVSIIAEVIAVRRAQGS